jgi:hypothetical protein
MSAHDSNHDRTETMIDVVDQQCGPRVGKDRLLGRLRTRMVIPVAVVTAVLMGCAGGGGECQPSTATYENGRTYIEQRNWCDQMHDQGVPCYVPPPPAC